MKIAVLNGSPKGEVSVTMQYVEYLQKKFPRHDLKIINISERIKRIEKNEADFQEIIDQVQSSDGVLWAFPVYTFLVPSQYTRFIELVEERGAADAFRAKYAAALSTSARVFDHTAHQYINAVCDDLEMNYVDFFSACHDDLLKEEERERLVLFADIFFEAIEKRLFTSRYYRPLEFRDFEYIPGKARNKVDLGNKKILILTDSNDRETNLGRMIERFRQSFIQEVEVVNLHALDIKGGCRGCIKCWHDNQCAYNDGYIPFFNSKVKAADIVVNAFNIKGRVFSSKHREFTDRAFFNHHTDPMRGKQMGGIASGPVSQLPYLMDIAKGGTEYSYTNYAGGVSDEYEDSAAIDAQLQALAERLVYLAHKGYVRPKTFLGVGAAKIVRDLTYGTTRFIFPDDHRFMKENGYYDFPQFDLKARAFNMMMTSLTKIPAFRREFDKRLKEGMIMQHRKIVSSA